MFKMQRGEPAFSCCDVLKVTSFCAFLQLPRPKWMAVSSPFGTTTFNSPAGILLRRFSLAFQGAYIVR